MAKKGGGSNNTKLVTTVAVAGSAFLLRKVLATAWTKITGKVPPTDLTDPEVTLPQTLIWGVVTGLVLETVRFAITRAVAQRTADPETAEE